MGICSKLTAITIRNKILSRESTIVRKKFKKKWPQYFAPDDVREPLVEECFPN